MAGMNLLCFAGYCSSIIAECIPVAGIGCSLTGRYVLVCAVLNHPGMTRWPWDTHGRHGGGHQLERIGHRPI